MFYINQSGLIEKFDYPCDLDANYFFQLFLMSLGVGVNGFLSIDIVKNSSIPPPTKYYDAKQDLLLKHTRGVSL